MENCNDQQDRCYAARMSTIEVRNVPEALRQRLEARAATAGMMLSDYLLSIISDHGGRPTLDELRAHAASRIGAQFSRDRA